MTCEGTTPAPLYDARFWKHVDTSSRPDGCWPWTGAITPEGYGRITLRIDGVSRAFQAHRYAHESAIGPAERGLYVLHSCEDLSCCNPSHLRLGTPSDNMAAMRAGRWPLVSREAFTNRLLDHIEVVTDDPGACWVWTARLSSRGYGAMSILHRSVGAHTVSYELFVGQIPDGLEIDHLCRNRACIRPDHLEAVTRRENVLRGISPPALAAASAYCRNGHEYTSDNTASATRLLESGERRSTRICRTCRRASRAAYFARLEDAS